MTDPNGSSVKTLGIKLDPVLHSQFSLIAALDEISLNEAVLRAVQQYVESKQKASDFAARAKLKLDEIEREAAARRGAIEALFGAAPLPVTPAAEEPKTAAKRKGDAAA